MRMKFDDKSAPKSIVIILIAFSRGVKKNIFYEQTVSCKVSFYTDVLLFDNMNILYQARSQWIRTYVDIITFHFEFELATSRILDAPKI